MAWSVRGEWNEAQGRHEHYPVPKKEVYNERVKFFAGHKVFVVNSHKYNDEEQAVLWKAADLQLMKKFQNSQNGYSKYGIPIHIPPGSGLGSQRIALNLLRDP